MTKLVEQLRNQAKWYAQPGHNARDLMDSRLLEKAADEIECLRAKIEQTEKQEPVGWLFNGDFYEVRQMSLYKDNEPLQGQTALYALPGAQPAPSVPEKITRVESGFKGMFLREAQAYKQGWNECRAAMLAAAPEAKP